MSTSIIARLPQSSRLLSRSLSTSARRSNAPTAAAAPLASNATSPDLRPSAESIAPAPTASTLPLPPPPLVESVTPAPPIKRPVGAFRGGLIGLLLGMSLVGGFGYFELLDAYRDASERMLASVEELKLSTEAMTGHLARIERVEQTLAELKSGAALAKDSESMRGEYRKLLEAEHLELLDLKAHVWGIEQDLDALSKRKQALHVRI